MKIFQEEIKFIFHKLQSKHKFAFSKYADGEWMMICGIPLNNNEFEYTINDSFYRERLIESFQFKDDNYYIGISCPCCQGQHHHDMKNFSKQDENHLTFANIFVNANYEFYKKYFIQEFNNHQIYLIANKNSKIENLPFKIEKFYPVENTAWKYNYNLINEIKKDNFNNKLFLFACGPFGNMLAHQLWENNKNNTYIDIGSTLNPWLQSEGFKRDYYNNSILSQKICNWS